MSDMEGAEVNCDKVVPATVVIVNVKCNRNDDNSGKGQWWHTCAKGVEAIVWCGGGKWWWWQWW